MIAGFHAMRRELMLAVAPDLFPDIQGSTDSEVLFHLALTHGLERDPIAGLEHAIGIVEATAARHGIERAVQARLRDGDRVVVSEPMSDLPGLWHEIPESTVLLVQPGTDEQRPFRPRLEPASVHGEPTYSAVS